MLDPLVYPYTYLIDTPDDGYVEEKGWLPGPSAQTAEEAGPAYVAAYKADMGETPTQYRDGDRELIVGDRKVWLRPSYTLVIEDEEGHETNRCVCGHARGVHNARGGCTLKTIRGDRAIKECECETFTPVIEYDDETETELYGAEAIRQANERGWPESVRWTHCEPGDDGAAEWWEVLVAGACPHVLGTTEHGTIIYCRLPAEHDGDHEPEEVDD